MGNHNNNKEERTILISGIGKLVEDSIIYKQISHLQINIEFSARSSEILSITVNCPMQGCNGLKKLKHVLIGSKVEEGIKRAIKMIEEDMFCVFQKSEISALINFRDNYHKLKKRCSQSQK
jgi:hypothetical protein